MTASAATHATSPPPLILGSTSRYRRELLERLHLPFEVHAPQVDETPRAGEPPEVLARRLALAKARAVATRYPQAVVIGSDQVADLEESPWASQAPTSAPSSSCVACAGVP